jgi:phosphate transport system protein
VRVVFQQELHEVQDRLVRIAELVEVAIRDATLAFRTSDVALAESVIDKERKMFIIKNQDVFNQF